MNETFMKEKPVLPLILSMKTRLDILYNLICNDLLSSTN